MIFVRVVVAAAALLSPVAALATAGYFQLGYGLKAKAMGGVAAALPQDSLVAATNPAGMALLGNRLDGGLEWFSADRGSEIRGNSLGLSGARDANGIRSSAVPEFGFNRMLDSGHSLGLSIYGNGGITKYRDNPLAQLGGSSQAGLEFLQAVFAPSCAVRLGEDNVIGVALNFVVQQFSARGFEHFDSPLFSKNPGAVTNRGVDYATGWGVRFGWMGRVTPQISIGAAYQPTIRMSHFARYRGLLADSGNFDVPGTVTAGIAWNATAALTLAADIERINFAGVRSIGNKADCFLATSCLLGAVDGPGSGWRNTTVVKVGIAYAATPELTIRAGFATLSQPIPPEQTLLNIFAPAVSERHVTAGATWQLRDHWELTVSVMHAFAASVAGNHSIPAGFPPKGVGGGEANLRMEQNAIGVELGWKM